MADLTRANPLGGEHPFAFNLAGCELRELPLVAKLRLQAMRGESAALAAEVRSFLGEMPNRSQGDDPCILWRAPDDWLAVSSTRSAEELTRFLGERLAGAPVVLADVSSTSAVLELRGEQALEVLARDCTLDLEGSAVPPGACAQTMIAQLTVLIHRPGSGDCWHLYVDRTAARHLRDFLVDSALLTIGDAETR